MLCLNLLWEQAAKINTLYLFTSKFFQEELEYRWCGLFFLNFQLLVLEASWPEESPPSLPCCHLLALKPRQWMLQGWAAWAISHPCNFSHASPAGYRPAKTHITGLSPEVWGGECKELCLSACKGSSLLLLCSPETGTVLQNSPPSQGIEPLNGAQLSNEPPAGVRQATANRAGVGK